MADVRVYRFRDPTSLVKWTGWSVYAQLVLGCLAVLSKYLERGVLTALQDGSFPSRDAAIQAAQANDMRQMVVSIAYLVTMIVSGILILRWIHRANWNARALGADMEFTPGGAVGWYFMPVANLWMPFLAMREIWDASSEVTDRSNRKASAPVGVWWFFWIVSALVGNVSLQVTMRAKDIETLLHANAIALFSNLTAFPLCIAFLVLFNRINSMQSCGKNVPGTILNPHAAPVSGATT